MKNTMKWFVFCVLALSVSAFAVTNEEIAKIREAMPDEPVVQPTQERTMLVFSLCKGFRHSCVSYWDKALGVMSEKTGAFKVVHSTDMSIFSPGALKQFDAICFNNTTKLVPDEAQQKAILDFIRGGKGIVGIHAATDNFYEWPVGMEMMGGKFTGHPWTANGTWAVKNDAPKHPLMKSFGGMGFKINDEIYRTSPPLYSRTDRRVLMSLDMSDPITKKTAEKSEDRDTGISWIKPVGKGRLFYCSLGHNHHLAWNKPVLQHYLAGIQYALGDYPVEDTPLGQIPAKPDTAAVDFLLGELKDYDWGKSRVSLVKLENQIKGYYSTPEALKQIELKLLRMLDTDVTTAAKDFICRQLAVIGSEASVGTLLKMLDDPETANLARYALEGIPSSAVDRGLLKKLSAVSDEEMKIGIITTLGVRKCDSAVGTLAKAVRDNPATAAALIQAMGAIGTLQAAEQLQKMGAGESVQDALLNCAESLFEQGKTDAAQGIYSKLYASGSSSEIRAAGLTGLVRCGGGLAMLSKAVKSEDAILRQAAIMQVVNVQDVSLLNELVSEMKSLPDAAKIQMLAALAANKKSIGRSEIQQALVDTENRDVRLAAYRALSVLGDASTAVILAEYAGQASDRVEQKQAREALYRLSGKDVDAEILKKIVAVESDVDKATTLELIRATAQRPILSACPVLLKTARSADAKVASESIRALQVLATADQIGGAVALLMEKPEPAIEAVVVTAAEKIEEPNSRARAILDAYESTAVQKTKMSLLRVLGKLGDPDSVLLLRKEYRSPNPAISGAAFRAMTHWPGSDFIREMKSVAENAPDAKTKTMAFRAYVRMLKVSGDSQQAIVDKLIAAYAMADQVSEQKIVIAAISHYGNLKAMNFVDQKAAEPALKAEAEVGLIQICEKLKSQNPSAVRPVLERLKASQNESVKKKAGQLSQ